MKFIWPNSGVLSASSSELDSAPAANITESHATNPWLADTTDSSPSITIDVTEGGAVLVYNIQAEAATVTAKSSGGSTIHSESFTLTTASSYGVPRHISHIWMEYTEQAGPHKITVSLTKGSSFAYAGIGIIMAGPLLGTFSDPNFGDFSHELEDHSLIIRLSGGVEHPIVDNIQRLHPATLQIRDPDEFYALMRFGRLAGKNSPFGCKMSEIATPEEEYLLYASFGKIPSGQPTKYQQNTVSFTLKEFL